MNAATKKLWMSLAMIALGLGMVAATGHKIAFNEELDVPLNPCGVNRSPYGEVFAMAMQGPINTYFHMGVYGISPEEFAIRKRKLAAENPDNPAFQEEECQNDVFCTGCSIHPVVDYSKKKGLLNRMQGLIENMRVGHIQRTNSLPANKALQLHLKHEAEDKMFMAYRLDPSHYANYTALHFFLIEGIGARPELEPMAKKLAVDTINYCLSIDTDPRPALTAASASTNLLHMMFEEHMNPERENPSPEEMMTEIARLDRCLAHYHEIAEKWDKTGNWELLSNRRLEEVDNRFRFIMQIRAAALTTIERIRSTYAK